jgi:hypothetical protein
LQLLVQCECYTCRNQISYRHVIPKAPPKQWTPRST